MCPFLPSAPHECFWVKITLSPIKSTEKSCPSGSAYGWAELRRAAQSCPELPGSPLRRCSFVSSALHDAVNTLWPGWTGAVVTSVWPVFSWPWAAPEWLSGTCFPQLGFGCAGLAVSHRWLKCLWAARAGSRGYGTQWVLTQAFDDASLHYTLHFFLTYAPWYIFYWSLFLNSLTI